jgi:hypothetical protein
MGQRLAFILGMSLAVTSQAYMSDYIPLPQTLIQQTAPLQTLVLNHNTPQLTPSVKVNYPSDDELVLSGNDTQGKPWTFVMGQHGALEAFQADLDQNGTQDILLLYPTMGNGLAPSTHLITLAFDDNNRPVVSEIEGYFETNQNGIVDVVDTNKNGKAELIYMNFDQGYWITSLYELQNARWQKLKKSAGLALPLYTRFTNRPNHQAVKPAANRHPYTADLTNNKPILVGKLTDIKWADVNLSEDIELTIQTPKGTKLCYPQSWYSSFMLVLDTPEERNIVSLTATEATVKSLLAKIKKQEYPVTLYGKRDPEQCSPELLWASTFPSKTLP